MIRMVNEERRLAGAPDVVLLGQETAAHATLGPVALAASYTRPTRVLAHDRVIPIVDHLMLLRLAVAALLSILTIWRLMRD